MDSARQDAEGLPVEVKVTSKGDGLYACSYTPASAIKHTLAVTWGGVGIPSSPFRVSFQSQHPVSGAGGAPEFLYKAERIKISESDAAQIVQAGSREVAREAKKPVIVIVTYTEERYSC